MELAALLSRMLSFYISHGSATRFLRGGEKYYIYFVDNLLLFPTVKEFSKSVNIWWSFCQKSTPRFLSQCSLLSTRNMPATMLVTAESTGALKFLSSYSCSALKKFQNTCRSRLSLLILKCTIVVSLDLSRLNQLADLYLHTEP